MLNETYVHSTIALCAVTHIVGTGEKSYRCSASLAYTLKILGILSDGSQLYLGSLPEGCI